VDVAVLYPTHVSSYCALRDTGLENALYRAYHRWVADFCAQAPARLKWTVVANMRDVASGVADLHPSPHRDPTLLAASLSRPVPPPAPRGQAPRQPGSVPAPRSGPGARPAAPGPRRHGAPALRAGHVRPRRRVVPPAQLRESVGGHGRAGRARGRRYLRAIPG